MKRFLMLLIPLALGAQTFTTTCTNNVCVITPAVPGTVTMARTAPTITSFSPVSGPTTGGTSVTITGTGFTGATAVTLGSVAAASFTVASTSQIVAVAAPGTSTGTVSVTTPAGTGVSTLFYSYTLPPVTNGPVSDDFNAATLNAAIWTYLNPANDSTPAMTGTQLRLTAPAGKNHDAAFGGMDNAVRAMQRVGNTDFPLVVRFDSIPSANYQTEGVIVEQDGANYLRFQFASDGTTLSAYANQMANGVDTNKMYAGIVKGTATSVWLGMQRTGTTWAFSYSLDGTKFVTVGTMSLPSFTMSGIGPFIGNYNATTAPLFVGLVNSFSVAPMPIVPPIAGCTTTVNPGSNVQSAINAATVGSTLCFGDGLHPVPTSLAGKAGVTYQPASGTPVIQGTGGYSLMKMQGNNTTIQGLTFTGGGIEITGSADNLNILKNTIGQIFTTSGGAAGAGIYQNAGIGQQISNSKFEDNVIRNIYGPGELTCNGQFPPNGQPCDYDHNGIIIYNQSNLSIQRNTLQTISGDAFHAFESISCGETGGPKVPQPNLIIAHNTIDDNHRIPIEVQLCGMTGGHIDSNLISRTYVPNAWHIGISFASECTGCTVNGNYYDGATGQGPGWGIVGTAFETGGTGTTVANNFATSAMASSGNAYYGQLSSVMGSNAVFTNNRMCGPAFNSARLIIWEPPCNTGACGAWSASNNTVAASCTGFPPPPTVP